MTALLLFAAALAAAPRVPQKPAAVPFQDETLTYSITWPSGLSLGEAQTRSTFANGRWSFALSLDAAVPGFIVSDYFTSSAANDFCSLEFVKQFTHGKRNTAEKTVFHPREGVATRTTLVKGGGESELQVGTCPRDALAFLYFLRRELSAGRVPGPQTVYFGAPYALRIEYAGNQKIRVGDRPMDADRFRTSFKGPKSSSSFEMFFAHDAARTPVLVRVPFTLGTFSMELVR